jgi:phosphoglycolate phosphatase-like HAD superfamily hydrolase
VVLNEVEGRGQTQSLLSMYRHDDLVPLVNLFGIADRFARIDGLRGVGGGTKAPYLEAHLAAVIADPATDVDQVLVSGDAVDDAAAAAHVGAQCVLYDGGAHPRGQLEATGFPVASTLTQAVEIAGLR